MVQSLNLFYKCFSPTFHEEDIQNLNVYLILRANPSNPLTLIVHIDHQWGYFINYLQCEYQTG